MRLDVQVFLVISVYTGYLEVCSGTESTTGSGTKVKRRYQYRHLKMKTGLLEKFIMVESYVDVPDSHTL